MLSAAAAAPHSPGAPLPGDFRNDLAKRVGVADGEALQLMACGLHTLDDLRRFVGEGDHMSSGLPHALHYKIETWYWQERLRGRSNRESRPNVTNVTQIAKRMEMQGSGEGGVHPTAPKGAGEYARSSDTYGDMIQPLFPRAGDEGRVFSVCDPSRPTIMGYEPPNGWGELSDAPVDPPMNRAPPLHLFDEPTYRRLAKTPASGTQAITQPNPAVPYAPHAPPASAVPAGHAATSLPTAASSLRGGSTSTRQSPSAPHQVRRTVSFDAVGSTMGGAAGLSFMSPSRLPHHGPGPHAAANLAAAGGTGAGTGMAYPPTPSSIAPASVSAPRTGTSAAGVVGVPPPLYTHTAFVMPPGSPVVTSQIGSGIGTLSQSASTGPLPPTHPSSSVRTTPVVSGMSAGTPVSGGGSSLARQSPPPPMGGPPPPPPPPAHVGAPQSPTLVTGAGRVLHLDPHYAQSVRDLPPAAQQLQSRSPDSSGRMPSAGAPATWNSAVTSAGNSLPAAPMAAVAATDGAHPGGSRQFPVAAAGTGGGAVTAAMALRAPPVEEGAGGGGGARSPGGPGAQHFYHQQPPQHPLGRRSGRQPSPVPPPLSPEGDFPPAVPAAAAAGGGLPHHHHPLQVSAPVPLGQFGYPPPAGAGAPYLQPQPQQMAAMGPGSSGMMMRDASYPPSAMHRAPPPSPAGGQYTPQAPSADAGYGDAHDDGSLSPDYRTTTDTAQPPADDTDPARWRGKYAPGERQKSPPGRARRSPSPAPPGGAFQLYAPKDRYPRAGQPAH